MAEYKDTLNLPFTDFAMKANLPNREPQVLEEWYDKEIYQKIRKLRQGKKSFILHDGPPYANGNLHCGHALNKILKDIIVKSKTLSGLDAAFIPGWDCHGLPIELNVEKKVGRVGTKISANEFRKKCREYATSQIDIQRNEFKRLGVFGDWDNPYITMNFQYEADTVRALGKIIKNGHLEQGFKPVHWCIDCGSALAEAEVEYEDKISPSIDVAFSAVHDPDFLKLFSNDLETKPVIVPIWTTTPWTLPANEAVCLNPEISYSLLDTGTSYFIIATDLVESCMNRYKLEFNLIGTLLGKNLVNNKLNHPFMDRIVPIILGEHVTTESGTGAVHTAPAHGPDDYQAGKAYNLPLINPVLSNGCFAPTIPFFAGISVLKANEPVINLLEEKSVLLFKENISHSYPHCWRHKTPIVFLATPQWFIAMDKNNLRSAMIKEINSVTWVPDWGKARIINMVEGRPDWCISRQRAWGSPMPLFIHKTTKELHPQTLEIIEKVAQKIEREGIDAWFDLQPEEILGADAEFYDKSQDTMDVWFDSGVSHYCVLQKRSELHFPADVYFEGSDQHRGWFNSSLTTAVAMEGKAPYRTVLTHGYTVDGEGKKLSKSKGNYVALDKLISQHGADIIRLWVSSTDYKHEVSISEEIIKRNADAYRRIRNTARFLLSNLFDFDPKNCVAVEDLVELDKWAIKRTQLLQEEIITAYENYQFHVIYQKIHNFCAMDMGSFYLDIIKDRQYTTPKESLARRSCQTAMYHILQALTLWLAPIISFTAEEIWKFIPGKRSESVFLEEWYTAWPKIQSIDMSEWMDLMLVRDEVNKSLEEARKEGIIGSGLAAKVTLYSNSTMMPKLTCLGEELRFLFITSEAKVLPINTDVAQNNLGINIEVKASEYEKCARCWHRCADLGQNAEHPELCARCIGNITDHPERRLFA